MANEPAGHTEYGFGSGGQFPQGGFQAAIHQEDRTKPSCQPAGFGNRVFHQPGDLLRQMAVFRGFLGKPANQHLAQALHTDQMRAQIVMQVLADFRGHTL